MSSNTVIFDASISDALASFRSSGAGTGHDGDWLILSYSDKSHLILHSSGTGGLDTAIASSSDAFPPAEQRYALLRRDHQFDMSRTVKICFIDYTPEGIAPMRKAMLSTHKGQVKDFLKGYHVFLEASNINEISDEIVNAKIGEATGSISKVTTKQAYTNSSPSTGKRTSAIVPDSVQQSRPLNLSDESAIKEAIKEVRSDQSDIDWVLLHYTEPTTLSLGNKGAGGIVELISHLTESEVWYGLFRQTEQYDKIINVKFCYLKLLPQSVLAPIAKARISTHGGFVQQLLSPYQYSFDIGKVEEISEEIVKEQISSYTGTKNKVVSDEERNKREAHAKVGSTSSGSSSIKRDSSHSVAAVPQSVSGSISFDNPEEFQSTLLSLRQGSTINWFAASYCGKDTLRVLGSGDGGFSELLSALEDDNCNFGLLKVLDKIDKSNTVKFVYIRSQPEGVSPLKKSQVSTKKGLYDKIFEPFHVEFLIGAKDELDEERVMNKVQGASGSKNNIVEGKGNSPGNYK